MISFYTSLDLLIGCTTSCIRQLHPYTQSCGEQMQLVSQMYRLETVHLADQLYQRDIANVPYTVTGKPRTHGPLTKTFLRPMDRTAGPVALARNLAKFLRELERSSLNDYSSSLQKLCRSEKSAVHCLLRSSLSLSIPVQKATRILLRSKYHHSVVIHETKQQWHIPCTLRQNYALQAESKYAFRAFCPTSRLLKVRSYVHMEVHVDRSSSDAVKGSKCRRKKSD